MVQYGLIRIEIGAGISEIITTKRDSYVQIVIVLIPIGHYRD